MLINTDIINARKELSDTVRDIITSKLNELRFAHRVQVDMKSTDRSAIDEMKEAIDFISLDLIRTNVWIINREEVNMFHKLTSTNSEVSQVVNQLMALFQMTTDMSGWMKIIISTLNDHDANTVSQDPQEGYVDNVIKMIKDKRLLIVWYIVSMLDMGSIVEEEIVIEG